MLNIFIYPTDTSQENEDIQSVVSQLEEGDAEKGIESELCKDKIIFVYAYAWWLKSNYMFCIVLYHFLPMHKKGITYIVTCDVILS